MTAEEKLAKIAEIYDHRHDNVSSHARYNLWGAILTLERKEGVDEICMHTLYRVMAQLAEIEKYLPLKRAVNEQN